jgi:hypothetical protein
MSGQLNNPPPSLPAPPPADGKLLFEQYKLAVEMAQGISDVTVTTTFAFSSKIR